MTMHSPWMAGGSVSQWPQAAPACPSASLEAGKESTAQQAIQLQNFPQGKGNRAALFLTGTRGEFCRGGERERTGKHGRRTGAGAASPLLPPSHIKL